MKTEKAAAIIVEVTDEPVETGNPYTDKQTGMTRPARTKQRCYLQTGARYPVPFKVDISQSGPYRPGFYLLAGVETFKPGEYDGLKFSDRNLQLVPLAEALDQLKPQAGKVSA